MRWKDKEPEPKPKDNSTRVVSKFLWRPLHIGNETRWLEQATWKEIYYAGDGSDHGALWYKEGWVDYNFIVGHYPPKVPNNIMESDES